MIRYAITDRNYRPEDASRWTELGVEFVQLRDKVLEAGELARLARKILGNLAEGTRLLVSGRADVAAATGAAGVHLTGRPEELTVEQVQRVFAMSSFAVPVVSASCHSVADVERAREAGVDLILFGPVFEKRVLGELVADGVGLEALRLACVTAEGTPVVALGGVTSENGPLCIAQGAAGVAGIRLFR